MEGVEVLLAHNAINEVLFLHRNAIKMDVPVAQDGWPDASEKKAYCYSMQMHWISYT
jgi:hypothetical protein